MFTFKRTLFCRIILIITVVSSAVIAYIIFLFMQTAPEPFSRLLCFSALLSLLLINIVLCIIYDRLAFAGALQMQMLVMQQQITRYQEALANKKANDARFRKERHNLKNQLIVLRAYAVRGEPEKVIRFINVLLSENEFGLTPYSFSDNILIDSILCSKKSVADEHQIPFTVQTNITGPVPFADTDLCILLGNALDNALDACTSCTDNFCFIRVTLQYKTGCLYCRFDNSYYGSLVPSRGSLFRSTKPDSFRHGYGLRSIRYVVGKYNGILDISTKNHVFSLRILLYEN